MSETNASHDQIAADALLAARIFALDPVAAKGVWVRGSAGAAVERWLGYVQSMFEKGTAIKRVPTSISDGRLIGGLDLSATLATGRPVAERGLLAEADQGVLLLPNVECSRAIVIAHLSSALDTGRVQVEREGLTLNHDTRFGLIVLDEGRENSAASLRERLSMAIDLTALSLRWMADVSMDDHIAYARTQLPVVTISDEMIEALCATTVALGIGSSRAPLFAVHVARASAALNGRNYVSDEDASLAVRLVLAPRATCLPSTDAVQQDDPPPPTPPSDNDWQDADEQNVDSKPDDSEALEEMLIAAAAASIPAGLLASLKAGAAARRVASVGRSGAKQKSKQHGRRSRSKRGDPRDGAPLDLLETLRTAAPWQTLRRNEMAELQRRAENRPVEVRREDFRVRTFKSQRETATIFVVDASGSAALHRLAETKGAIELLLADCYSRRDHVALIAFRGKTAELLLPPTRSLTRVKRSLASLPGGGGTPLALAADAASALAEAVTRKGQSATVVFLTDGKANIDRNGAASRPQAEADAMAAARVLKSAGYATLVIDTSPPKSGTQSGKFAAEMGARYLALPYANAALLSEAVREASNAT